MSAKSAAQLRQEIAAEREQLGAAVHDLRTEVDELKRKLPYVAAAVLAAAALVVVARKLLSR